MEYVHRFYRAGMAADRLRSFQVAVGESDLWIGVNPEAFDERTVREAEVAVMAARAQVQAAIARRAQFRTTLEPLLPDGEATPLVRGMCEAGVLAGTGPMAAVAGAVAQAVGRHLLDACGAREVIVENGGDIFVSAREPVRVLVFAGPSPLSNRIGVILPCDGAPLGVCTSSGTVGPSLSFGRADAVMVACADAAVADAWATSLANRVGTADDIAPTLELAASRPEILSCVIVAGDRVGVGGRFEMFVQDR